MFWTYEISSTHTIPVSSTSVAHFNLPVIGVSMPNIEVDGSLPPQRNQCSGRANNDPMLDPVEGRRLLHTYELAPATPWYVWAIVALAFIIVMAWLCGSLR
jgi:hypothetical protein